MSHHALVIPYLIPSTSIRIDATFMDVFDQNLLMDGKSGPKRISGHHKNVVKKRKWIEIQRLMIAANTHLLFCLELYKVHFVGSWS